MPIRNDLEIDMLKVRAMSAQETLIDGTYKAQGKNVDEILENAAIAIESVANGRHSIITTVTLYPLVQRLGVGLPVLWEAEVHYTIKNLKDA